MMTLFKSEGFSNKDLLDVVANYGLKQNSNIIYQAGDAGPTITFDVAEEIVVDTLYDEDKVITLYGGGTPGINPKSGKSTVEDFIDVIYNNMSKKVALIGNGLCVKEVAVCDNFESLKEYIIDREDNKNVLTAIEKANLNYPVLVLDDCV